MIETPTLALVPIGTRVSRVRRMNVDRLHTLGVLDCATTEYLRRYVECCLENDFGSVDAPLPGVVDAMLRVFRHCVMDFDAEEIPVRMMRSLLAYVLGVEVNVG